MGQYHYTVNLTKREFLDPHKLGDGLKLVEQSGGGQAGGVNDALHLLLAVSNGRGGGDFEENAEWVGRWGGDRIAVVGDYAEVGDIKPYKYWPEDGERPPVPASEIYNLCIGADEANEVTEEEAPVAERFRDITEDLIPVLESAYEICYYGDGWRHRAPLQDLVADCGWSCGMSGGPGGTFEDPEGGRIVWVGKGDSDGAARDKNGAWYPVNALIAAIRTNPPEEKKYGEPVKRTPKELGVKPLKASKRA